jgi:hypothetical protein
MLASGIILLCQRFAVAKDRFVIPSGNPCFGSGVPCHDLYFLFTEIRLFFSLEGGSHCAALA